MCLLTSMQNFKLVEKVKEIADKKGCTPGQLALAWVHSKGDDIFPIPGEDLTISPLLGAVCMTLPSACSGVAVIWILHRCLQVSQEGHVPPWMNFGEYGVSNWVQLALVPKPGQARILRQT